MKKKVFNNLDLNLYEEVLDNGLSIYVIPMDNVKNIYVTFTTKFGSNDICFIPRDGKEFVNVPYGIAHFLEHKMFEQKDGVDPFTFYSERGSDANANTNNFKTTYLFSGTSFFKENMNFLLDYVQNPYFTDENVEKEKGIIEQEMKMYMDNPYSVIFEKMNYNMFNIHPMKIPVIGNYKSIYSTTKEELYTCYNTFYHPSNMFVVVSGNVNPEEVIATIKENQSKKEFSKKMNIVRKEYDEDESVAKKNDEMRMNVTIPKVGLGFKFIIKNIDIPLRKVFAYINFFFDITYDSTSILNEELINDNIITEDLYISTYNFDNIISVGIMGESYDPKEYFKRLRAALKKIELHEEDFDRKKKALLASCISTSDKIFSINNKVVSDVVKYGEPKLDDYNEIKSLTFEEFNEVVSKLDFSNYLTYVVKPKETIAK